MAQVVIVIPTWLNKKFEQPFRVIKALNVKANPALQVIVFFSNYIISSINAFNLIKCLILVDLS